MEVNSQPSGSVHPQKQETLDVPSLPVIQELLECSDDSAVDEVQGMTSPGPASSPAPTQYPASAHIYQKKLCQCSQDSLTFNPPTFVAHIT
eukprot:238974-Amphidinium_carterae.1